MNGFTCGKTKRKFIKSEQLVAFVRPCIFLQSEAHCCRDVRPLIGSPIYKQGPEQYPRKSVICRTMTERIGPYSVRTGRNLSSAKISSMVYS